MRTQLYRCQRCLQIAAVARGFREFGTLAVYCACGGRCKRLFTPPNVNASYANSEEFQQNKNFLGTSEAERTATMKADDAAYERHWSG